MAGARRQGAGRVCAAAGAGAGGAPPGRESGGYIYLTIMPPVNNLRTFHGKFCKHSIVYSVLSGAGTVMTRFASTRLPVQALRRLAPEPPRADFRLGGLEVD